MYYIHMTYANIFYRNKKIMATSGLPTSEYKNRSLTETFLLLHSSDKGLTESSAQDRIATYGKNEISEKKEGLFIKFCMQYWGPMPWLLELAMILSFTLQHTFEGYVIFSLMTINAIIGFIHSRSSQKAIALLKQKLAIQTKVLRDENWTTQEASILVPGDIINIRGGDIIPADVKIIRGTLSVDESMLTGESFCTEKQTSDLLYSGSMAYRGEAHCIVLNTGSNTCFGKIISLVKNAKPTSHQEEVMISIVRYTMYIALIASGVVISYAFTMHIDLLFILSFILILLMGAVPVALPTVMTMIQAITSRALANEGVLVTRLDSIEDAASISILCLDKTGTITQNKPAITNVIPFSGYTPEEVIKTARMSAKTESMDQIDLAICTYAKQNDITLKPYKELSYTPFSPDTKRTEALIEINGAATRVLKGASQVILPLCNTIDDATQSNIHDVIEQFSKKGFRIIAVASSEVQSLNTIKLVGLIALSDNPRPDSQQMIQEIQSLGIKPIMLTGDGLMIAREIAKQVGIGTNIIPFADIQHLDTSTQVQKVLSCDGFGRCCVNKSCG